MNIVPVRKAIRDDWRDWGQTLIPAPKEFNRAEYQEKIDKITGKSREKSILRLEWGGEETIIRYKRSDEISPFREVTEPKFKLRRRLALGGFELVPIRRWIITQLCEPEQYKPEEVDDILYTDSDGILRQAAPKPKEFYTPLIYVGDHNKCPVDCCDLKLCLGDYKHPDNAELYWIAEKTYMLFSERIGNPRKPLGQTEMLKIMSELNQKPKLENNLDHVLEEIQ